MSTTGAVLENLARLCAKILNIKNCITTSYKKGVGLTDKELKKYQVIM